MSKIYPSYKSVEIQEKQLHETLKYKNHSLMQISMAVPVLSAPAFKQAINRINHYYESQLNRFYNDCKGNLFKLAVSNFEYSIINQLPFHPYEVELSFFPTYNQQCIFSAYLDQYIYTGSAHGITKRSSNSWFVPFGKKLSMKELFPSEPNYKDVLLEKIMMEINENPRVYYNDYRDKVQTTFEQSQFYLSKEALTLYFQAYQIAPFSSGIPTFNFPYDALNIIFPKC